MTLPIDPVALARALHQQNLPPPIEVSALGPPRATASFRLRFGQGARVSQLVLRCVMAETGRDPLATEQAAIRAAGLLLDLPIPVEYTLLPTLPLGRRAALCSFIEGRSGDTLFHGEPGVAVLRALGETLGALDGLPQPGFATRATGTGVFVPRRASWREEITASLWSSYGAAQAAGTDLGATSERVFQEALDALGCLDEVRSWVLVHGDLHPGNLLFQDEIPRLVGVIDWEHALVGDALMDWAWAVEQLPAESLAGVLLGYGPDRAAALREPGALARLGVYVRARCLHRMAYAALRVHDGNQGRGRALLLERARIRCEQCAEPAFVAHKLDAALDRLSTPAARPLDLPPAWAGLTRRVLERLREAPEPDPAELLRLAGALAAAERVVTGTGFEHELVAADVQIAPRPPDAVPLRAEPIADRAIWRAQLVASVLSPRAADQAERCAAVALVALILCALERIRHAVPDAALRGLESASFALRSRELRSRGSLGPAEALVHGLIGLWAVERLHGAPSLAATLRHQCQVALRELRLSGAPTRATAAPSELGTLLPVLLLALENDAGREVGAADDLLDALPGLRPPASA